MTTSYNTRLGNAPSEAIKAPVSVETTVNITLANVGQTINGHVVATNDRILVKDQTDTTENGIYVALPNQAWQRAKDFNHRADVIGGQLVMSETTRRVFSVDVVSPWYPGTTAVTFTTILEPGASTVWGIIGGTLADQTDLQAALDARLLNTTDGFTGFLTITADDNQQTTYPLRIENAAGTGWWEAGAYGMNSASVDMQFLIDGTLRFLIDRNGHFFLHEGNLQVENGDIVVYDPGFTPSVQVRADLNFDASFEIYEHDGTSYTRRLLVVNDSSVDRIVYRAYAPDGTTEAGEMYFGTDGATAGDYLIQSQTGTVQYFDASAGAWNFYSGTGVGAKTLAMQITSTQDIIAYGGLTVPGVVSVDDTTQSTSTVTGSIHTDGGLGVVKDAFIGGNATIAGDISAANFAVLQNYISGFTLSNGTDTVNDIDIQPGVCANDLNDAYISLASVLTKQIDVDWAAGSAAGGFPSALTLTNDTWYHVFVIYDEGGNVVDGGYDTSITADNLLTDASAYDHYRRVGAVLYGTATIVQFVQVGDYFYFTDTIAEDVNDLAPGGGTPTTGTATVPVGLDDIVGHLKALGDHTGTSATYGVWPFTRTDMTLTGSVAEHTLRTGASAVFNNSELLIPVDSSAQFEYEADTNDCRIRIATIGWFDPRGGNG